MNRDLNDIWNECLQMIRENVPPQAYSTWFEPIKPVDYRDGLLTIQVPSDFFYEYLESRFIKVIKATIRKVLGPEGKLEYSIMMDTDENKPVVVRQPSVDRTNTTNPPKQIQINFDKSESSMLNPFVLPGIKKINIESNLNKSNCFENFVTGECNRVAYEAGVAIAKNPGKTSFNPMFIFSPTGMGKTHICQAIGLETKKYHPELTVLYVNAEQFLMQFQASCRNNNSKNSSRDDFVHFYQMIDVLIIDDIQFLADKVKTQEAFFHIFNHLFRNGKQIILASDRPPVDLQGMKDRLLTRFSCGLIAELEKPNVDLCVDILNNKCRRDGLKISQDVLRYIAETANGSVRDLQGVINSLLAYSVVYDCNIDMHLAERVMRRAVKTDNHPLTIDDILERVCNHYNVTTQQVLSRSRKRDFVAARQMSMYFAQKYTKMPASRIGQLIGGRDHSTVIHSCTTIEQRLKVDKAFVAEVESIENTFKLKK